MVNFSACYSGNMLVSMSFKISSTAQEMILQRNLNSRKLFKLEKINSSTKRSCDLGSKYDDVAS